MKKLLKVGLVSLALVSTVACASSDGDFGSNEHSLIGIEGGSGSFDFDHGLIGSTKSETKTFGEAGLKIGAQTDDYRIFLSARYYDISGFKNTYSIGAEAQYLANVSKYMNIFVGLNVGIMNFKYAASSTIDVSDKKEYYGADAGVNIHLIDSLDLEIGARYMYLGYDYQNNTTTAVGKIDHMINGYGSLIYKFKMD